MALISSLHEIINRLDPESKFIGMSYSALSIKSLDKITSAAKYKGLFVIVGGQAATGDRETIVKEQNIDAVVVGDGERAIQALSKISSFTSDALSKVPNLMFRDGHKIQRTQHIINNIAEKIILPRNLGGIEPEQYFKSYNKNTHTLTNIRAIRPTNIYSKRGCSRTCSFCARVDKKIRSRKPEDVISEITMLVNLYGVDYIMDISDTWVQSDWLDTYKNEYLRRAPENIRMMIFADVRDITSDICRDLKAVGIDNVLLGIESGSERILLNNMKKMTRDSIKEAVRNLISFGIKVSASFVVGLIGEDEESLAETASLCEELYSYGPDLIKCYCNVIIPLPGSLIWKRMIEKLGSNHVGCRSGLSYNLEISRNAAINNLTFIDGGVARLESFRDQILSYNGLRILEYAR